MQARSLGALVVAFSVCAGTAIASNDPYADQAAAIACPAPPSGWAAPAGSRDVLTPYSALSSGQDPSQMIGAPVVQVNCRYVASAGRRDLLVSVRYALPADINPWNDFYIGCSSLPRRQPPSTAAKPWNARDRVYRIVGSKTWSLATFDDSLGALQPQDVGRFEAMTRSMLKAAQPLAHNCKLAGNGGAVGLTSDWVFSFAARTSSGGVTSSATTSGTFVTTAGTTSSNGAISSLRASDFRLSVAGRGTRGWIGLHVGDALGFTHAYDSTLKAQVVVTGSSDPKCRRGSTGTLTVTVPSLGPAQLSLDVCGATYLAGKGRVVARIVTA